MTETVLHRDSILKTINTISLGWVSGNASSTRNHPPTAGNATHNIHSLIRIPFHSMVSSIGTDYLQLLIDRVVGSVPTIPHHIDMLLCA